MTDNLAFPAGVFDLHRPRGAAGAAVFSSPHSGADYPAALLARSHLPMRALRSSEDAFVEQLFGSAPEFGAPLLAARVPRAWLDLNRAADELDPALVSGAPKAPRSPRINAGLGVIPRVVSDSRLIMHGKISLAEAQARIDSCHRPYHAALGRLMSEARELHGCAILFDCHSMPHEALSGAPLVNGALPQIVLGDRFGAACDRWITDAAIDLFSAAGFRVARNAPFAGGFITQHYGRPARGFHSLQIEIDRSLYMDERRIARKARFLTVQRQIREIVRDLCDLGKSSLPIAAE